MSPLRSQFLSHAMNPEFGRETKFIPSLPTTQEATKKEQQGLISRACTRGIATEELGRGA